MKHPIQILLLLLSLLLLTFSQETTLPAAFAQSPGALHYQACDPYKRPGACTFEYAPVCGYIHDCKGGECSSTFGNKCLACAQEDVDGYVERACQDVKVLCNPYDRPDLCPMIFAEVCAVAANCEGPHCFEDVYNSCEACRQANVAYSLPGPCPYNNKDERTYCDDVYRPIICDLEPNPVCAHRSSCVGDTCYFIAGSPCEACFDTNVDYHLPGICSAAELGIGKSEVEGEVEDGSEGETEAEGGEGEGEGEYFGEDNGEDDRTYCDLDNRPVFCTYDSSPVCAHRADCDGNDCLYTAINGCGACSDDDVDWHSPGECPNGEEDDGTDDGRIYCDPNFMNRPQFCSQQYDPVCGHLSGCDGVGCERIKANACAACDDTQIDSYTPGECLYIIY